MADQDHLFEIFTCQTSGFFKYPIEFATRGRETHSYMTIGPNVPNLKPGTYSMEPGGLVWRPFDYWQPADRTNPHSNFHLDKHQQVRLVNFLIAHKNVKYDWFGDILVGIDDLTPKFMDPAFHLVESVEDRISPFWFCSAMSDAAFTAAGVTVIEGRKKWAEHGVTPMDLFRDWKRRGWTSLSLAAEKQKNGAS